jgi:hypothetical protein
MILDKVHGLTVQFLNALPYLTVKGLVISELELISPVTKIARKYEYSLRIVKILGENLTITIRHLLIHWPRHDWYQFYVLTQTLYDIG